MCPHVKDQLDVEGRSQLVTPSLIHKIAACHSASSWVKMYIVQVAMLAKGLAPCCLLGSESQKTSKDKKKKVFFFCFVFYTFVLAWNGNAAIAKLIYSTRWKERTVWCFYPILKYASLFHQPISASSLRKRWNNVHYAKYTRYKWKVSSLLTCGFIFQSRHFQPASAAESYIHPSDQPDHKKGNTHNCWNFTGKDSYKVFNEISHTWVNSQYTQFWGARLIMN